MAEIHIGSIILAKLTERGMSKTEFAKRVNTTRENVYGIFKRKSLDTELLSKIGTALDYDFFAHYTRLSAENEYLKNELDQLRTALLILRKDAERRKP
jgi:hypothetical protein